MSFSEQQQQQQQHRQGERSRVHPSFHSTLAYFATRLAPLVSCSTGETHPDFPATLLSFHLLSSEQLDNLARHFHQVYPPVPETWCYPLSIPPWIGTEFEKDVDISTKRRRFGRFIGLRGCTSPVTGEGTVDWIPGGEQTQQEMEEEEQERQVRERLEREWEESMRRARRDSDANRKFGGGGFRFL